MSTPVEQSRSSVRILSGSELIHLSWALATLRPDRIAAVLREAPDALTQREVVFDQASTQSTWCMLLSSVKVAEPDDALVIFNAMMPIVRGNDFMDRARLMKVALSAPDWAVSAIQQNPDFFLTKKALPSSNLDANENRAGNAFQVLASLPWKGSHSHASMLEIIRSLKAIGLQDSPNPNASQMCLHAAAMYRPPSEFLAFLEEFIEDIEAEDYRGDTPMHYAMFNSKNVASVLLNKGANPRKLNKNERSPLSFAISKNRFDFTALLIESGAYGDDDIDKACEFSREKLPTVVAQVEAFYAAFKAKKIIGSIDSGDTQQLGQL